MRYDQLKLYQELFGIKRQEIFLAPYSTPHRFFHTEKHLERNLMLMTKEGGVTEELIIANLFHDLCYDPRRQDNEQRSAQLFTDCVNGTHSLEKQIVDIILDTAEHKTDNPLNRAELYDINHAPSNLMDIRNIEQAIFKEYQLFPVSTFVDSRQTFLMRKASAVYRTKAEAMHHYNVAVYAGSFNPIHIGHQSVIEQAEQIFDKVIIAVGINPEKGAPNSEHVKHVFPFHEVISYEGLLPNFITELEQEHKAHANFTLIRGLRNGADLAYETNQLEFMRKMKPDIKVTLLPCDKTREHISSSAIRSLATFSMDEADKYLVKKYRYEA